MVIERHKAEDPSGAGGMVCGAGTGHGRFLGIDKSSEEGPDAPRKSYLLATAMTQCHWCGGKMFVQKRPLKVRVCDECIGQSFDDYLADTFAV